MLLYLIWVPTFEKAERLSQQEGYPKLISFVMKRGGERGVGDESLCIRKLN